MAGALVDKLPDGPSGLNGVYLKNADGTATFHTYQQPSAGGWVSDGTDAGGGTQTEATPGGWQASNYTARVMKFDTPEPTSPAAPAEPDFYTMSRREEAELVDPTATTAEATLAANKGLPVKTELANQQSSGPASVYAERDREKTIEQSGILARVLSGQLA